MSDAFRVEEPDRPARPSEITLLETSSLGRPEVTELAAVVDDASIDDALDRLDRLDHQVARGRRAEGDGLDGWPEVTHGPLVEWRRELDLLLDNAPPLGPNVSEPCRVAVLGDRDDLDRHLLEDVEFAHEVVDALGGDWAAGHHRRVLRAARIQVGLEAPQATARRSVSGFVLAAHQVRPLRSVFAPVQDLPIVRGRDDLIARLVASAVTTQGRTTVLVGEAGYGKSTTALAVARDLRARSVLALWVVAHDEAALVDGLEGIALQLGATASELDVARKGGSTTEIPQLWALIDRFEDRWLLVLDDAGPEGVGRPEWLHRPRRGTVLVTSRYGDQDGWGPDAEVVTTEQLEPEHGGRLLLDVIGLASRRLNVRLRGQARRASELLRGMPLALTSLGTTLRSKGIGVDELVAALDGRPTSTPLENAYEMCLNTVGAADLRSARRLLRLLACFAPDVPLPRRVLDDAPESRWNGIDGVGVLVQAGLITEREAVGGPVLFVQTAVAEHARRDVAFTPSDVATLDDHAVALLAAELERADPGRPDAWPMVLALKPHLAEVLESPALIDPAAVERALSLADRASEALMRVGDHGTATTMLDRALRRFALDADHPTRLAARRTRAWMVALDAGGDLRRASQQLVGLLAETRQVLGRDHLTTLAVQDCLGWVLAEQGDLEEARKLVEVVLTIRRRVLGDEHRDTLATRHRLAWLTAWRGDLHHAEESLRAVLDERERLLGADHLDVFSTRYRLAWTLNERGLHTDSEQTYRALHADLEVTFGPQHPLTLMVSGRLAWALAWLNRFDEAEARYESLIVDQQKVLGVDHPRVLATEHFLAVLWLQQGRIAAAESWLRAVAARRTEVLGADHPLTLESRHYQAWALFQLGAVDEAERQMQAVFVDRVGVLGERHPETLTSRYLLARVLTHRGRLADAEDRLRRLLGDMATVFGETHRILLRTRVALAAALGLQGNLVEAEQILRDVLSKRVRELGPEHRETLSVRDQLSWTLCRLGRLDEAAEECRVTLDARMRVLGPDHPSTLLSRHRAAWVELRAGRWLVARVMLRDLLADLRRVVENPSGVAPDRGLETLRCRTHYVESLRRTGELDEAAREVEGLVTDLVPALGEDAVATMRGYEELAKVALARGDAVRARRVMRELLERRLRVHGNDHPDTLRLQDDLETLR